MSIDRAQADAVASAVDLIATALGDGLDVDEAARLEATADDHERRLTSGGI